MYKSFYMNMSVQGIGRNFFICLIAILLFASCKSYKKVPYLQDAETVQQAVQQENLYDAKIMPKDLLTIVVSCTSPELAVPFNLTVATPASAAGNNLPVTPE
jgi:polysaccharide biosynthesis/export protein